MCADVPRLREVLEEVGRDLGLDRPAGTGAIWARWADIVGASLAQHSEPSSLRDGLLRIRTESPLWATEIAYFADEIAARANRLADARIVRAVKVWTGPGALEQRSPAGPPAPRRSGHDRDGAADPHAALERARRAQEERSRAARGRPGGSP